MTTLPSTIFTGCWSGGHIQGIALDKERKHIYCSFTTQLVKLDLEGRIIGSVKGLTGHLGCLCLNPWDGRIYGSLEYKNDVIGRGILQSSGISHQADAFYVAIFDGDKITRLDMDAQEDQVMTTVHLGDVLEDYAARWMRDGKEMAHRYGCSGIDGISFGPGFGEKADTPWDLYVAYGVYGDTQRTDNDYQVLLRYDVRDWRQYERPLNQRAIHRSGPEKYTARYFVFTGNTTYGVQNLEYDPASGSWLMAVYPGKKPAYPNYPLYLIDGAAAPTLESLKGLDGEKGLTLSLCRRGLSHPSGVWGWPFPYGATGIIALGDNYFYFCDNRDGAEHSAYIRLYHWGKNGLEAVN